MPVWNETVDLKDVWSHDVPWNKVRDECVPVIKRSTWHKNSYVVQDLVVELEEALNVEEFDSIWHELYDEADRDRVWIATF